jgi:hypothetical protein
MFERWFPALANDMQVSSGRVPPLLGAERMGGGI